MCGLWGALLGAVPYINILVLVGEGIDSVGVVQLTSLASVVVLVCWTEIHETHVVCINNISVCLLVFRGIGRGGVQSIEQPESVDVLVVTVLLLGLLNASVGWGRVVECGLVGQSAHIFVHLYGAVINVYADVVGLSHIVLLSVRGTVAITVGDEQRQHIVGYRHLVELDFGNLVPFWFLIEIRG